MAAGSHHPCALRPAHAARGGRARTRPLLNAGPVGAPEPGHPPKPPFPLSPAPLLPPLIAASSDCGTLAQVGSAQLVGGGRGGGRYAGGAGGALVFRVVRLARVDLAPPFPSPAPSVIAAARADCGMLAQVGSAQLVAEGVGRSLRWGGSRRCRGSGAPAGPRGGGGLLHRLHHPSVALGQLLARPEPGLVVVCLRRLATAGFAQNHPAPPLPCLLPCLFRPPAEPEASEDEYECRREAAATVCIPVSVAVSLSDGQPQKHTLHSGTRV